MRSRARYFAALVALTLLLSGCSAAAPSPDHEIGIGEWFIGAPSETGPGEVVLTVRNGGQAHHNLTICPSDGRSCSGNAITQTVLAAPDTAREPDAYPEETTALMLGAAWEATVAVALEPGTYLFYCALANHPERGMRSIVEVVDASI
jgi:plastocyanin